MSEIQKQGDNGAAAPAKQEGKDKVWYTKWRDSDLFLASAYDVVTWIGIAIFVGLVLIYGFQKNWRAFGWSIVGLLFLTVIMLGIRVRQHRKSIGDQSRRPKADTPVAETTKEVPRFVVGYHPELRSLEANKPMLIDLLFSTSSEGAAHVAEILGGAVSVSLHKYGVATTQPIESISETMELPPFNLFPQKMNDHQFTVTTRALKAKEVRQIKQGKWKVVMMIAINIKDAPSLADQWVYQGGSTNKFGRELISANADFSPINKPFKIDIPVMLGQDDRNFGAAFWLRQANICSPIHRIMIIRITNQQSIRSMVETYTVETQRQNGTWAKLSHIDPTRGNVFMVEKDMRDATLLHVEALDNVLQNRAITPKETIEGWAFFELPEDIPMEQPLRIYVKDFGGAEIVEVINAAQSEGFGQGAGFNVIQGKIDLSACAHRYYSETR
jgi:hypothetical protein